MYPNNNYTARAFILKISSPGPLRGFFYAARALIKYNWVVIYTFFWIFGRVNLRKKLKRGWTVSVRSNLCSYAKKYIIEKTYSSENLP
jgi:hypothetical protein